jgi:hypothetical protein
MKIAFPLLAFLCAGVGLTVQADSGPTPSALAALASAQVTVAMTATPAPVEQDLARFFASIDQGAALQPDDLDDIVNLTCQACTTPNAFRMADRWNASGAGNAVCISKDFQEFLHMLFGTNIPMYTLYADMLRYAAPLDQARYRDAYLRCVTAPAPAGTVRSASFLRYEETTPNPDAGSAYTYTSACTFIRTTIAGHDALLFTARVLAPSSIGLRGVNVGNPLYNLYYYSNKSGTNLRGLSWADSQIYVTRLLSVFVDLGDQQTALFSCTWVRAGWNDFNVVAADSIYQSLSRSLQRMRLVREYPRVTAARLAACAERVLNMPQPEVTKFFDRYCAYVRYCQAQQSTSWAPWVRTPLLTQLYDPATFTLTTEYQKRALILQEYVRIIAGHPTWSHDDNFHTAPR